MHTPYYLLLKSYLENRSFSVKIDSTLSGFHNKLDGVHVVSSDIAPFLYILFTADIPTTENTLTGTYADHITILAFNLDSLIYTHLFQNHLNMLSKCCNSWKIKVNELKSTHITFTLRLKNCLEVFFNNSIIPTQEKLNNSA